MVWVLVFVSAWPLPTATSGGKRVISRNRLSGLEWPPVGPTWQLAEPGQPPARPGGPHANCATWASPIRSPGEVATQVTRLADDYWVIDISSCELCRRSLSRGRRCTNRMGSVD